MPAPSLSPTCRLQSLPSDICQGCVRPFTCVHSICWLRCYRAAAVLTCDLAGRHCTSSEHLFTCWAGTASHKVHQSGYPCISCHVKGRVEEEGASTNLPVKLACCLTLQITWDVGCGMQANLLEERDPGVLLAIVTLLLGIVSRSYEGAPSVHLPCSPPHLLLHCRRT